MQSAFLAQIEEIHKHRWIESQKVGHDVGEDWAARDWILKYAKEYRTWLQKRGVLK